MSKTSLVIGKFMPFHKGHKELIEFASNNSDFVKILVLGTENEPINVKQREYWIKESFEMDYSLNSDFMVKSILYDHSKLNSSSESDIKSSQEWCEFLKDELIDVDIIVGSELYVQYMAEYSNKEYLLFDVERSKTPISATLIKNNPLKYWDYLTPSVKRSYAHHICICGTESSGKTTLSTELEKEFEYVTMIPEIGRCLVGNAVSCEFSTLMSVLTIHKTLLEQVIKNPPTPIVVWDTDNLTTKSYMEFFELGTYKEKTPIANVYFFLDSNIPYEKDISRLDEEVANKLKFHHFQLYKNENVNLHILNNKINVKEYVKDYISKHIKNIVDKIII